MRITISPTYPISIMVEHLVQKLRYNYVTYLDNHIYPVDLSNLIILDKLEYTLLQYIELEKDMYVKENKIKKGS